MGTMKPTRTINTGGLKPCPDDAQIPCDESTFFESFYKSTVKNMPNDRDTIGGSVTEPESRYHYNVVENSIISALAKLQPLPPPIMIDAWHHKMRNANRRLLDVGSGTGHWIDFFVDTYLVAEVIAVEVTESMSAFLETKYADNAAIKVLKNDIADPSFNVKTIGGAVDYVSAIGVMFHITDDMRWERALANIASTLKQDGVLFVGGEFGNTTRNVQFHHQDSFDNWREFRRAEPTPGRVRVNKRVRSLEQWRNCARACNLHIVDVIRTPKDPRIATPEDDLLVLVRAESEYTKGR